MNQHTTDAYDAAQAEKLRQSDYDSRRYEIARGLACGCAEHRRRTERLTLEERGHEMVLAERARDDHR